MELNVQRFVRATRLNGGRRDPVTSVVTQDVLRATEGGLRQRDAQAIQRLDPDGVEQWRWVSDGALSGWVFEMAPLGRHFKFFAFRDRAVRGRLLLAVIEPNMDDLIGHADHIIGQRLGDGRRVPVVCGSRSDISCGSIEEVRGVAAKFVTYHSLRSAGRIPYST